jgi:Tfp pilus assembly protein PilN
VSKVNLLPRELRQKQATRRTTAMIAAIGAAVLLLVLLFYVVQTMRLSSAQDELATQEATNAQLESQIAELQPYADLQAQLVAKQGLVDLIFLNEVSWSGVLVDVSRMIPDDAYLTNLSGQITAQTGTQIGATPAEGTPATGLIGGITFQGVAGGTDSIATWLTRLESVKGWVNAWVNSAQETGAYTRIYGFDSGVDLSVEAATGRGQGKGQQR